MEDIGTKLAWCLVCVFVCFVCVWCVGVSPLLGFGVLSVVVVFCAVRFSKVSESQVLSSSFLV